MTNGLTLHSRLLLLNRAEHRYPILLVGSKYGFPLSPCETKVHQTPPCNLYGLPTADADIRRSYLDRAYIPGKESIRS